MGDVTTIGLDIAKASFQAHGADSSGAVVFRKKLRPQGDNRCHRWSLACRNARPAPEAVARSRSNVEFALHRAPSHVRTRTLSGRSARSGGNKFREDSRSS